MAQETLVRVYRSTDAGAPTLNGTAGSLVNLLTACLVNGYGTVTLNSLSVSAGVATATVNTGHGLPMVGGVVGVVVEISGATPSALNGVKRIVSSPTSSTFTFDASGVDDGAASGTITAKRASAGWGLAYSGTDKAAYRPSAGSRLYLRVEDTTTTTAQVRGYETMTGIDADLINPFPTVGQRALNAYLWRKSSTADSTARPWLLLADGRRLLWFPSHHASYPLASDSYAFGDLRSARSADAYACLLAATATASYGLPGAYNTLFTPWASDAISTPYCARAYTQIGGAAAAVCLAPSHYASDGGIVPTGWTEATSQALAYPNSTDNALYLYGEIDYATNGTLRGALSGVYSSIHRAALDHGAVVSGLSGLNGTALLAVAVSGSYGGSYNQGRVYVDLLQWFAP